MKAYGLKWLAAFLFLCLCNAPVWAQTPDSSATCAFQIVGISAAAATADGGRPAASAWEPVTLLDDWARRHPDFNGGSIWYRIDWRRDCPGGVAEPAALLVHIMVLAGEVFVGEQRLFSDAQMQEPLSRSWNMPRRWILPEAWLHDGVNTIWVRVVAPGGGQSAGLGPVLVGSPEMVDRQFDYLVWNYRTLIEVNIIVSTVIGILFFFIWLSRRDQSFYGWYAASGLFWLVTLCYILATNPWPFTNSLTLARVTTMAVPLHVACGCLFYWRFGGLSLPRLERALWGVTFALLAVLAITPDAHLAAAQWTGFLVPSAIFYLNCLGFIIYACRTRQLEHGLMAICLAINSLVSVHDTLVLASLIQTTPLLPYAEIATTLALSAIIGLRHARNLARVDRFNEELAVNVAQARGELAATMERDHALTLANTRLQDRLQIAHDLHDGLGGALVHMMASVEQGDGALAKPKVLSMLKFIRDDLRQTIDSNNSAGVSVPSTPQQWIAPLRHRFTALFDELGIVSNWGFPNSWRTPPNALQYLALTRLIEEALTNVIKHSRAQHVQLRLCQTEPALLVLEIEDDGVGFDVAAVRGADIGIGMRSMSVRIARVGGKLDVVSAPGHTVLTARLALTPA